MKIIGVVNQKGGVGKTTVASNIAYGFARKGLKTLLIDFDPQGNQTFLWGIQADDYYNRDISLIFKDKLRQKSSPEILEVKENLFLVPASESFDEVQEASVSLKEMRLQKYLHGSGKEEGVAKDFDIVVVDALPERNALMFNVIIASDYLLIPMHTTALSETGTEKLLSTIALVNDTYEKNVQVLGVIPTAYTPKRILEEQILSGIKELVPKLMEALGLDLRKYDTYKPFKYRQVVREAQAARMPLLEYIEEYARDQRELALYVKNLTDSIVEKIELKQ